MINSGAFLSANTNDPDELRRQLEILTAHKKQLEAQLVENTDHPENFQEITDALMIVELSISEITKNLEDLDA